MLSPSEDFSFMIVLLFLHLTPLKHFRVAFSFMCDGNDVFIQFVAA